MTAALLGAALVLALGAVYLGGVRAGAESRVSEFALQAGSLVPGVGPPQAVSTETLKEDSRSARSSRELDCLTQAVYFEARGETPSGQAAVAQVVLNRVRKAGFPKSVCGVVFQGSARGAGCQFSFTCDGSMRRGREAQAWAQARRIASRALAGAVMTAVGDATHFHTIHVSPDWSRDFREVAQVGLHIFYRAGQPDLAAVEASEPGASNEESGVAGARLVSGPPAGPLDVVDATGLAVPSASAAESASGAPAA